MKNRMWLFISTAAAAIALASASSYAASSCSAYPTGTADKIESKDVDAKFGAVPAPTKDLRFVYIPKSLLNIFWQDVASGIQKEASKYKIKVEIQAPKDETSLDEQLSLAQTIFASKPDALLLSPQSDTNLLPVIEAAKAANIPTVVVDDARTEGASTYVGTDQVAIGSKAADFLHQLYPNGGKIAQIEGQAGSPNGRKRIQGFTTTLKNYPNLQLVASQPAEWVRLTAMNVSSDILRAHPDLIGIYADNDDMALGTYEAVAAAGLTAKVVVVGTDGTAESKRSVAEGQMKATVAQFPYEEGILGVQMALRLLGCQALPPWILSPQSIVTADNVKDFPNPPPFKP